MDKVLLIVNPQAAGGRAAETIDRLLPRLAAGGLAIEVVTTGAPGEATRIARDQADRYDWLVAAGGDGTVVEVASGLLAAGQSPVRIALLPLGTGNDTGGGLGIRGLDDGLAALLHGRWRAIDAIAVTCRHGERDDQRLALLGVGAGAPAAVLSYTTPAAKKLLRRWSYHYAAWRAALAYRAPRMTITADGQRRDGCYFTAAAVNLEYTAGQTIKMAPGARSDDGLLDLLLIRDLPLPRRVGLLPRLKRGDHLLLPEVELLRAREVHLEADPPARLNLDGELYGTTPVTLCVLPQAIEVRVPIRDAARDHRGAG